MKPLSTTTQPPFTGTPRQNCCQNAGLFGVRIWWLKKGAVVNQKESLQRVSGENLLSIEAQPDNAEEVLVHGETKEKPTDSILTTLSEVTKAIIETIEVNSFTPSQEACEVESQVLNKEIERGIAYKDEAESNDNGQAPHSAWRNYDDFNEYFWSLHCFELSWPWRKSSAFFMKPKRRSKIMATNGNGNDNDDDTNPSTTTMCHTKALAIIGFHDGNFDSSTIRQLLSLGPTFVVMKLIESEALSSFQLDHGNLVEWFYWWAIFTLRLCFGHRNDVWSIFNNASSGRLPHFSTKSIQGEAAIYKIYIILIGIYAGVQFFISFLMRIPACHRLTDQCDRWSVIRLIKWMRQEHYYVGRGMYERTSDFATYTFFWLIILAGKFAFAYFLQASKYANLIKPLVKPTRLIVTMNNLEYSWHDFVSRNNHNALTVLSIWAPMYLLDIHVFYTILSAIWGFLMGARDRLGEIRSLDALHQLFEQFPRAFVQKLYVLPVKRVPEYAPSQVMETSKDDAARFSPFWNEIIRNLREEDYITNLEMELLLMPKNSGNLPLVQWPLFLLASKIFLARDIAAESKDSQDELWERISRDEYMKYAVMECYHSIKLILMAILEEDGRKWVERVYEDIEQSVGKKSIHLDFDLSKLSLVIQKVSALMGVLKGSETEELHKGAVKAIQDLYDVMRYDVLAGNMRDHMQTWNTLSKARADGTLFSKLKWPKETELKTQIKRLYSLLTIKDSAANVPKNLEAQRRLKFFTNSLFMDMPSPKPVREMMSFSVFTPYYSEIVLYSLDELRKKNEDGISLLFYLQKIFPGEGEKRKIIELKMDIHPPGPRSESRVSKHDEWRNFLARIGRDENAQETDLFDSTNDIEELRFWASYRGQTLARTVRGMMYYRKALILQTYLERIATGDVESPVSPSDELNVQGFELSPEARAEADLKFTYVVTCQIYGKQKEEQKPEAADIALLMQRNEALRVAFIDVVETMKDGKVQTEYYSKLVKGDINGQDKEIYSIKLPGNPKLGEGKPENQNHAIVFTRGQAVQTIDMNQDNYFEEALKMRNLLEEFNSRDHGIRLPTILGVREHVFTGSVSSLASFMSNQESSFVTLGQRVLAKPLKVRMHYGHPDVFDRVFHITRGGISKASRVVNISEDIFAGFNSTLRQGNITHHEYIQVGKGRDVGLNQIALFEGKVAGGNGEQVLSRDVYRLGQLFDFFRMMSFYFTTVGFYVCTMLTVLTVYIFLYGKTYLVRSVSLQRNCYGPVQLHFAEFLFDRRLFLLFLIFQTPATQLPLVQALSGVGETIQDRAHIMQNAALGAALNTQFLIQIGVFTAIPMILCFILEQGFFRVLISSLNKALQWICIYFFGGVSLQKKGDESTLAVAYAMIAALILQAIVSFITMQFQLCSVFFTFSLGTRTHYFGRTILHGGARVCHLHT
ncbi:hypothetical protein Cgig2_032005 [Carnegiea gigantea]|uniref:1,3-beta-glucan synthase n=1 Tax=Carnegiea gigantea TaxID=171969 RepID=A0A9Q1K514_9CARY|nr:hypothetical protein Cgig2_032005 [Carnegiea gigantea]